MRKNKVLANKIKTIRHDNGLTQDQMAEALGVSRSTLAGWETGIRKPNTGGIMKICESFAVSFEYMCGNDDTDDFNDGHKIDWSLLSPVGKLVIWEIYKCFTYHRLFGSRKGLRRNCEQIYFGR